MALGNAIILKGQGDYNSYNLPFFIIFVANVIQKKDSDVLDYTFIIITQSKQNKLKSD